MEDNRVPAEQVELDEALKEVSRFTVEPDQWAEWFEKAARLHSSEKKYATKLTCESSDDAIRKINVGYFQLRENFKEYRGRIRLSKRGQVVWILPAVE